MGESGTAVVWEDEHSSTHPIVGHQKEIKWTLITSFTSTEVEGGPEDERERETIERSFDTHFMMFSIISSHFSFRHDHSCEPLKNLFE